MEILHNLATKKLYKPILDKVGLSNKNLKLDFNKFKSDNFKLKNEAEKQMKTRIKEKLDADEQCVSILQKSEKCKKQRSEAQEKGGNHCYTCQKPVIFYDAYANYNIGKMRCDKCHKGNNNNKRPPTPSI
ncbi:hypothetical protein RhiirA5_381515 [Rhizophagus irregularis]|uniref:Uncharacterized protein n=1 Tax=Rhizophagus irregularis TaxID=588596 RepID=A0A2N0P4E8_9GLOM|nr:hypothetical protein RhiirA5_381515 [Rhizophagus irregularis]